MYEFQDSPLYQLLKNGKKHKYQKGQTLHIAPEQLFFVLVVSGYIKRYLITDDGAESIQSVYGPDTTFPLTPVYSSTLGLHIYKGEETMYYETMTETTVYSVTEAGLLQALEDQPVLYKDLFYAAGVRLNSNIQRLENMSLKSANRKVIDMLLYFADMFGQQSAEGIVLEVPLTHQTLANVLNMARETVSHTLARLQERELIKQLPKFHIVIPDVEQLKHARH